MQSPVLPSLNKAVLLSSSEASMTLIPKGSVLPCRASTKAASSSSSGSSHVKVSLADDDAGVGGVVPIADLVFTLNAPGTVEVIVEVSAEGAFDIKVVDEASSTKEVLTSLVIATNGSK